MSTRSFRTAHLRTLCLCTMTALSGFLAAACDDKTQLPMEPGPDAASGGSDGGTDGSEDDVNVLGDALSDGSDPEGSTGEAGCGGEAVLAEQIKVNVVVVIDRSGSMNQTPAGFTDTKWATLVASMQTSLNGVKDKLSMGLEFFPDPATPAVDGCGMSTGDTLAIDVGPGTTTVPLIITALADASNAPLGNTPTADALALALRYFTTGPGAALDGERYVLLALDGGPNCNDALTCDALTCTTNVDRSATDPTVSACPLPAGTSCCGDGTVPDLNKSCLDDQRTIEQVTSLATAGIPTFVVGIPGSDLYVNVLDALAVAGGKAVSATSPKYFEVADPQQLTDTLVSITTSLVKTCEFQLKNSPPDPGQLNVYIDGEVLPQDGPDGWEYDDSTSPPTIRIKGEACDRLQTEGAESVTFEFGCPTVK